MSETAAPLELAIPGPRLDAAAAPAFKAEMSGKLSGQPSRVLLDLTAVEFIDSTGLGVLVSLLKQMGSGGRIAVVGAGPAVRRLFQITRMESLFTLCDTAQQARDVLGR